MCMCVHVPGSERLLVNDSGLEGYGCADMPTCRGAAEILRLSLLLILFAWLYMFCLILCLTTRSRSVFAVYQCNFNGLFPCKSSH